MRPQEMDTAKDGFCPGETGKRAAETSEMEFESEETEAWAGEHARATENGSCCSSLHGVCLLLVARLLLTLPHTLHVQRHRPRTLFSLVGVRHNPSMLLFISQGCVLDLPAHMNYLPRSDILQLGAPHTVPWRHICGPGKVLVTVFTRLRSLSQR